MLIMKYVYVFLLVAVHTRRVISRGSALSTELKWTEASRDELSSTYINSEMLIIGDYKSPMYHNKPLPQQCLLGHSRPGIKAVVSSVRKSACVLRGIRDRIGARYHWKNMSMPSERLSALHLINELFRDKNHSVANLLFIGDSINTQLAQFLTCDLLRTGMEMNPKSDNAVASFNHTIAEFIIPARQRNPVHSLFRIHNKQFNLPCIHNIKPDCHSAFAKESKAYFHTLHTIESALSAALNQSAEIFSHRQTYVVFNYGLHVKKPHLPWATRGMAKALIEVSEKYRNDSIYFLYRETSAQTFWYSEDGSFRYDMDSAQHDGLCCSKPTRIYPSTNWRDSSFTEALGSFDHNWNKYIGYIPFFNTSVALYDLRIEYNNITQRIDCSHFIYTPLAYTMIWLDIAIAIQSLVVEY